MDSDTFRKFVEEKRSYYKRIGKIFCPILNGDVYFNAQGFHHLRYNGLGKERSKKQQRFRMNLLEYSSLIIARSKKVSEYRIYRKEDKNIQYWKLAYSVHKEGIVAVILKRIGYGNVIFYSIWK